MGWLRHMIILLSQKQKKQHSLPEKQTIMQTTIFWNYTHNISGLGSATDTVSEGNVTLHNPVNHDPVTKHTGHLPSSKF